MQITKNELKQIIEEELATVAEGIGPAMRGEEVGEPLPRRYDGPDGEEVITPESVTGELWNLAAKVHALGEEYFSESKSLAEWIEAFMERHGIAQQYGLEEGEEVLPEGELEESDGPKSAAYWAEYRRNKALDQAKKPRQVGSVGSAATVSPQRGPRPAPRGGSPRGWQGKY